MIISVASGKGGTGKTTVSTNLALSIEDCDVEEPNAHLFINPRMEYRETVSTFVPKVDAEACSGCGKCAEICRFNALTVIAGKVMVFPELCHSCEGCKVVCPEDAVLDASRELGIIERGNRDSITFINGRMRIGEAMAPPLIREVREKIDKTELTIIDAPPGTSCPVIAAMKNVDFILLVTEPTPFGLHDLQLAVEAVKLLGIPHGLVINRSDMGDDKVLSYARAENIPVLLEIPFDRTIAEIYSKGQMLVEEQAVWKKSFQELYQSIVSIVESSRVSQ